MTFTLTISIVVIKTDAGDLLMKNLNARPDDSTANTVYRG